MSEEIAKELTTAKGQTPLELAVEFMDALRNITPGIQYATILKRYCEEEKTEQTNPQMLQRYEDNFHMGIVDKVDVRELPIMKNNKFPMSLTFLNWVTILSNHNVEMFTCLMGLFATYFYSTHYKTERMTLQWLYDEDCAKPIAYRSFFYWYLASKYTSEDNKITTVYEVMKPEDFYSFRV